MQAVRSTTHLRDVPGGSPALDLQGDRLAAKAPSPAAHARGGPSEAGGTSPLPGRSADSWGVGYYYLATSSVLRQTLGPVAPSVNEQGFELYYNAAVTSWFTLSADIQAVDPAQFEARSAFLFGLRAKIDF